MSIPQPAVPVPMAHVPAGSLLVCGGGTLPDQILAHFVELAGGSEGRLVVIPTAGSDRDVDAEAEILRHWVDRGLKSVSLLHTRDSRQADTPEFVAPLSEATAVWIRGGQQSRLAETYLGTATERAIVDLFHRGGVVGGTSAGAAIQSRVMIQSGRAVPKLATGLDLLPDSIVDQHFSQRDRFGRLLHAVREHPGRVGVGIDETTAIVFRRGECRVLGGASVTVVSAKTGPDAVAVQKYRAGDSFSLLGE
ncbi:MAG: cyanophycinase [Pirellulales bacterium]|nr:cyanophycinase [Pirellulales bacterium]